MAMLKQRQERLKSPPTTAHCTERDEHVGCMCLTALLVSETVPQTHNLPPRKLSMDLDSTLIFTEPAHLLGVSVQWKVGDCPAAVPIDGDAGAIVRARRCLLGGVRVADPDLVAVLVDLGGPPSDVGIAAGQSDAQEAARLLLL